MMDDQESQLSDIIDLIERLEQLLLNFEEMLDTQSDKTESVHQIFRIAHNLKSTLGLAQRDASSQLIHAVESNFDLVRNGLAEPTQLLVHKSLMAVDAMRFNVFLPTEHHAELVVLQRELEQIHEEAQQRRGGRSAKGKNFIDLQFPLSERQRGLLAGMVREKFNVYQIEKIINPQHLSQDSYETLPIYDDIRDVGIHIATYPEYKNLPRTEAESVMRLVIATTFELDELEMHIFDPVKPVDVEKVLSKASSASSSSPEAPVVQGNASQASAGRVSGSSSANAPVQTASVQAAPAQKEVRSIKKMNILIAEDDFVSRTVIHEILSPFGVCDLAADGREALLAYEQTLNDGGGYDLICLDIMMPMMDGTQALKGIREMEDKKHLPIQQRSKIVMTTALDSMDQIFKAFRLQCDAYITKPISRAKVLNQLRKLHLLEE
ncbi:MAG: hybrid sensor histidine kinase/response regulator [Candidatus Kapaibacterium sp.]|nr:MAG: hybrid sensor histidine kinase/response regulator [Candidatus Kapabacteria bacterium]